MRRYYIYPPLHGECFRVNPSVAFLVKFVQGYSHWPTIVVDIHNIYRTRFLHSPHDRNTLTWVDETCLGQ